MLSRLWKRVVGLSVLSLFHMAPVSAGVPPHLVDQISRDFCACLARPSTDDFGSKSDDLKMSQCMLEGLTGAQAELALLKIDLHKASSVASLGEDLATGALKICPGPYMELTMSMASHEQTVRHTELVERGSGQICHCLSGTESRPGGSEDRVEVCTESAVREEMSLFEGAGLDIKSVSQMEEFGRSMAKAAMLKCPGEMNR